VAHFRRRGCWPGRFRDRYRGSRESCRRVEQVVLQRHVHRVVVASKDKGAELPGSALTCQVRGCARHLRFHDLDEYVFGEILSWCDVYTVLSFTRVSVGILSQDVVLIHPPGKQACRHAALTTQLWIILIRDLEFRGMLDLHPDEDLSTYSTPDLTDEVKRIVMGNKRGRQPTHRLSLGARPSGVAALSALTNQGPVRLPSSPCCLVVDTLP
jgi:hypothetical protein